MTAANGYNPLRWDCERRGCFNLKRRPKIEVFAECFPGRINFGDVDGIVEIGGNALLDVETGTTRVKNFHGSLPVRRRLREPRQRTLTSVLRWPKSGPWHSLGCSRSPGPTGIRARKHQAANRPRCRRRNPILRHVSSAAGLQRRWQLEWKSEARELPTGQRILYERLTLSGLCSAMIIVGDAETMTVAATSIFDRGLQYPSYGYEPANLPLVKNRLAAWSRWAAQHPSMHLLPAGDAKHQAIRGEHS